MQRTPPYHTAGHNVIFISLFKCVQKQYSLQALPGFRKCVFCYDPGASPGSLPAQGGLVAPQENTFKVGVICDDLNDECILALRSNVRIAPFCI